MISVFKKLSPMQQRVVRFIYLLLIAVLGVFAFLTHRQLQALRSAPVVLPNYGFYVVDVPEKAAIVQALGTWVATTGPKMDQALQTTTIDCKRAKMLCIESTAQVAVGEGGILETMPTIYEISEWTDDNFVSKPTPKECATRVLTVNLVERIATVAITPEKNNAGCKESARTLKLESGRDVRRN